MAIPTLGLPVSKLVRVDVFMSPQAAATRSFGSLLICGDSDVIDVTERIRQYDTVESVGLDFGADSPEYKAAVLYYSQRPRPADLYIGRWATEPTQALAVVQHGGLVFWRVSAKIEAHRFGGVVLANALGHVDDVAIAADQQRPERAGGGRLRRHEHIDADQLGNRQAQGRDGHDLVLVELQGHFQRAEHCIALLARKTECRGEIHPVVVPLVDQLGHAHGLAG
jgi:hypothetical protein